MTTKYHDALDKYEARMRADEAEREAEEERKGRKYADEMQNDMEYFLTAIASIDDPEETWEVLQEAIRASRICFHNEGRSAEGGLLRCSICNELFKPRDYSERSQVQLYGNDKSRAEFHQEKVWWNGDVR